MLSDMHFRFLVPWFSYRASAVLPSGSERGRVLPGEGVFTFVDTEFPNLEHCRTFRGGLILSTSEEVGRVC